uniref:cytochrome P450 4F22 n=1 Tax=Ciona intestinalis TaxID=7719 RepID=UPI0000522B94|nr:cytochrome P450 4F22 [Ciona intestinalis]|eukprot:XP_002129693.1 cytochrome P450 4F22 [Ciona intestinalis]
MLLPDYLEFSLSLYSIGAVCVVVFLYKSRKLIGRFLKERRIRKELTKEIDGPQPHWLFGHLNLVQPNEETILKTCEQTQKYPKLGMVWFGPALAYLMVFHPHVVRPVLNVEHPKDNLAYRFIKPWIGDGLLVSHGSKWRRNRHLLTKAFHFDILKQYTKVFDACCKTMLEKWSRKCDGSTVEVFRPVSLMTLDSMLQCAISCETECQQEGNSNAYTDAVFTLTTTAMKRIFNPFCHVDWIFAMTKSGRQFKAAAKLIHEFDEKVIRERRQENKKILGRSDDEDLTQEDLEKITSWRKSDGRYLDFLDMLILTRDDDGKGLTEREIRDEVDTFLFEGHDTTASGIAWSLYCLAANEEYQEKCREEIEQVVGSKDALEWQDLSKLPFVTMFIKEVLRLYPPVFAVARRTEQPVKFPRGFGGDQFNVGDEQLPKSDCSRVVDAPLNIGIPIMTLHRNEQVWEDAKVFDPYRFSTENCAKRSPYAYLPFSAGPRNCIGQNFAMAELKTVLVRTLLKYKLYVDNQCPDPKMSPMIVLKSLNGIHIKLKKI